MPEMPDILLSVLAGLAVGPFFWSVAILIFVFVATRNYRSFRDDRPPMRWPIGEEPLAEMHVDWLFMRTHTVLTNRRMVQWRLSWLFSRRKLKTIALQDVRSVVFHRHMNWALLLAGAYFIGSYNPLAFVLVLLGVQARVYTMRANTPFAHMPLTRITVSSPWRAQLAEMSGFYEDTQWTWSRASLRDAFQASPGTSSAAPLRGEAEVDRDFSWGRPVLAVTLAVVLAGLVQRNAQGWVIFDDYIFAPLYLGIPVAMATRSLRDAMWTATLAFVGLLAVKFPGGGWLGFLASDSGFPAWSQYGGALATLLVITVVAHRITRATGPLFAPAALLLWVLFASQYVPGALGDMSLYSKVALAMAWSFLLRPVDQWLAAPRVAAAAQPTPAGAAAVV